MTISRIDSATAQSGSDTALTPGEPTNTAENDYVFCQATIAQIDGTWTDPADFTEITNKTETLGNLDTHIYLGFKKRGSGAGNGYTFTYSGTAGHIRVSLLTLRGVDLSNFLDISYVEGDHYTSGTNNPNGAAKAITASTANAWVLLCQSISQTITGPTGVPSGYTNAANYLTETNRGHFLCTKEVTGTETPGVYTHTDSVGTADSRIITLAIKPATSSTSKLAVLKRIRGY